MPPLSIALLRQLIRSRQYVVSLHAADELEDDGLSVLDLESIVLTGRIVERQRDRTSRELKVVVRGQDLAGATSLSANIDETRTPVGITEQGGEGTRRTT